MTIPLGVPLSSVETPTAAISRAAVDHNAALMHAWIADAGAELWPHAKTIMSPELVAVQLAAGSTGMTVATATQASLVRSWGVQRIMLANQLVQPDAARRLAQELRAEPGAELWSFVDSLDGIAVLREAAEEAGVTFDVLLEVGLRGGRSGVRPGDDITPLLDAIGATEHLRLRGVAAYEGAAAGNRSATSMAAVDGYLADVAARFGELVDAGVIVGTPVFSAGGSMFFDNVRDAIADRSSEARVIIRSGCYLLHDHLMFTRSTPLPALRPALTVWGTIHSRPEPGLAMADIGRRDIGQDQGDPVPVRLLRRGAATAVDATALQTKSVNDHHLHIIVPEGFEIGVGDRIEVGISHPCTTMDKWRTIPLVDEQGNVEGEITTYF